MKLIKIPKKITNKTSLYTEFLNKMALKTSYNREAPTF